MAQVVQSALSTRFYQPGSSEFPILLEHYEIHGIIGEGGMGRVFKARHTHLNRFVAIKTLRIEQRSGKDLVGRFKQEMELLGQMDHPNVVRSLDGGEKNGILYLVMEFLSGSDLSSLSTNLGPLDPAFACELINQAALGLDYIHAKSLIHRDIKPSNLMLTTSGHLKILDLGLARAQLDGATQHERTPNGYAVGTHAYMAPEQATADRHVDGRTDIYSLGCTLFKLVTGRTPYSGPEYDNVAKVLNAHCYVPLTSADGFQLIPKDLRNVVLKMTAKDPERRYRTGREVAEALAPFFGDLTGSALLPHPVTSGKEEIADTPVRPLTDPLPEELSRLTASVHPTPQNTPPAPASAGAVAQVKVAPYRPRLLAGTALLAAGVTALVWFLATTVFVAPIREDPAPNQDRVQLPEPAKDRAEPSDPNKDKKKPPEVAKPFLPRDLDLAERQTIQFLLDQPPLPVGYEKEEPLRWMFMPKLQHLDARGGEPLVFPLGTTAKSHYKFEATVSQAVWVGYFGVFWGYQETPHLRLKTDAEFASFQMILVSKKKDPLRGEILKCVRGTGHMYFNHRWEMQIEGRNKGYRTDLDKPAPNAPVTFEFTIRDNRLIHARFGENLTDLYGDLCHDEIAKGFNRPDPYKGGVGVFTEGSDVRFSNARFITYSKK